MTPDHDRADAASSFRRAPPDAFDMVGTEGFQVVNSRDRRLRRKYNNNAPMLDFLPPQLLPTNATARKITVAIIPPRVLHITRRELQDSHNLVDNSNPR